MTFKEIIETEKQKQYYKELKQFVESEYETKIVYPPKENIFRCFRLPYDQVKVVILGQDPYHEPGEANGLAFSVNKGIKLPPSLRNIYKEIEDDLGVSMANHGDLSEWASQGVLLLNTVMTVEAHHANSHKDHGWEIFTDTIIQKLSEREKPMVFILWGRQAISKKKLIDTNKHLVLESAHPSPLSSYRGFFGSKPFSKTNTFLVKNQMTPIDWRIR